MKITDIKNHRTIENANIEDLKLLADDIRKFLIEKIAETGGHLSSNLGVIELTLALHKVFNPYENNIVFDVGHQTYVHKILTGRAGQFDSLRKKKGLSGFPNPEESPSDLFKTGHVGTAIALTAGISIAEKFKDENRLPRETDNKKPANIAIIGDGSLTNGEILESLNFLGNHKNGKMIVILNDNGMSISRTHSAVSKYISRFTARLNIRGMLNKIYRKGRISEKLYLALNKWIIGLKSIFITESLLEDFGFQYVGPIDGHNMEELVRYFRMAKKLNSSLILHIRTVKGKGYPPSEKDPELFHSAKPFNIKTGEFKGEKSESYTAVFSGLIDLSARLNENVFAMTAAMSMGTGLSVFASKYPRRFIDVGIAESIQSTIAAGMAKKGLVPVCCVYSTFAQRALDQIYHDVILNHLPVIYCLDRNGCVGGDGSTHHGIYTINFLVSLPEIEIYLPLGKEDFFYYFTGKTKKNENSKDKRLTKYPSAFLYPKDKIISIFAIVLKYDKTMEKIIRNDFPAVLPVGKDKGDPANSDLQTIQSFMDSFKNHFIDRNKYYPFLPLSLPVQNPAGILLVYSGGLTKHINTLLERLDEKSVNISVCGLSRIKPFPFEQARVLIKEHNHIFICEEMVFPGFIYSNFLHLIGDSENSEITGEENQQEKSGKREIRKNLYPYSLKNIIIDHASRDEQLKENGLDFEKIFESIVKICNSDSGGKSPD